MALSITKADVLSFAPCQCDSIARIDELFAGRERLTVIDVLALGMPDEHKLWLILRPQLIPQTTLDRIFAEFHLMLTPEYRIKAIAFPHKLITFVLFSQRRSIDDASNDLSTLSKLVEILRSHL